MTVFIGTLYFLDSPFLCRRIWKVRALPRVFFLINWTSVMGIHND